ALNRSEFRQNRLFAQVWAAAAWQSLGLSVSPLSPDQAIAVMAFTMGLHEKFNEAVLEYWHNFQYKTLHFLLTQAVGTLRDTQGWQCLDVSLEVCGVRYEAQLGATVRFGRFVPMSLSKKTSPCEEKATELEVRTCHGGEIWKVTSNTYNKEVLIPPFETFEVIGVTWEGEKTRIQLRSTGAYSSYNCEWLRGDSTGHSLG
ncbi:NARE ribosyltransferase, partial [Polioptila caerulea]|nr:NARE ribosyltransferase [Polioptila caerulea]